MLTFYSLPPPIRFFSVCSHFSISTESSVPQCGCRAQEWTFPRVAAAANSMEMGKPSPQGKRSSCDLPLLLGKLCLVTKASPMTLQLCTSQHKHSEVNSRVSCYLQLPLGTLAVPQVCLVLDFIPQAGNPSTSTHRFEDVTPCRSCDCSQRVQESQEGASDSRGQQSQPGGTDPGPLCSPSQENGSPLPLGSTVSWLRALLPPDKPGNSRAGVGHSDCSRTWEQHPGHMERTKVGAVPSPASGPGSWI